MLANYDKSVIQKVLKIIKKIEKMIEYADGPRDCVYLLYKNQLYTKCTQNEFWKCRNKNCNLIIRIVNDLVTKETNHPMHGEVTMVEIECLKSVKQMKCCVILSYDWN